MLGAAIHKALRRWFFKVPSHDIGHMPLFAAIDVAFIAALSPTVWLATVRSLAIYQRRLRLTQWPSLSDIYPRSLMWAYVYLLFWWARYCDVVEVVRACPDKSLLAEMFIRYVCAIDSYVDSFDSRRIWQECPLSPQRLPQVREIARRMLACLCQIELPPSSRYQFLRLVGQYRRQARHAMHDWAVAPPRSLPALIRAKERTAGDMWCWWGLLLGLLYDVNGEVAKSCAENIFRFGMGLQVVDDITDMPVDSALNAQNLLLGMIWDRSEDARRVEDHLREKPNAMLDARWARNHIPDSFRAARELFHSYTAGLLADTRKPRLAAELYRTLETISRLQG